MRIGGGCDAGKECGDRGCGKAGREDGAALGVDGADDDGMSYCGAGGDCDAAF